MQLLYESNEKQGYTFIWMKDSTMCGELGMVADSTGKHCFMFILNRIKQK